MARTNSLENFLDDVAAAIKIKLNNNTPITASQFDAKILEIPEPGTYQTKSITILQDGNVSLLPDTGYDAMDRVNITVNTTSRKQVKTLEITSNGSYQVNADEGYDALSSVAITVDVHSALENQHVPLYFIDTTDDGNLICINNYDEFLYVPYSLDNNGNFIVTQDDTDMAVYSINENMELEVVVNG